MSHTDIPGQYMFGDDLLVAPITQPASEITGYAHQKVWLPPGRWINWFTDDIYDGPRTVYVQVALDEIPLFARAGAIIPTATRALRTHQMRDDLLVLHIFPGVSGETILYEDDGVSADYDSGGFTRTRITAEYKGEKYGVTVHPATGQPRASAPRDMDASLAFGSDDGIVIWLNDDEVHRHDVGRPYTPKENRVPIALKRGANKLLVKISQDGGMWGFGMHVETPDGEPLPEVTTVLKP